MTSPASTSTNAAPQAPKQQPPAPAPPVDSQFQAGLLAAIVEFSDDAILTEGLGGIITSWNKGAERIFGYTASEMLGSSILKIIPAELHPEELSIQAGIRFGNPADHLETRRLTKGGKTLNVSVTASPIKDTTGQVIGISKIARDITGRSQLERELKSKQEVLNLFIEHTPAVIAMFDEDMNYVAASRRWREFYRLNDQPLFGQSHSKTLPTIPDPWREVHRRCLAGTAESSEEDKLTLSDGSIAWVRWEVLPWRKADGSIGGVLMLLEDITERKEARAKLLRLNEELEEAVLQRTKKLASTNKELASWSHSMAHTLRGPLRAMPVFASWRSRSTPNNSPQRARSIWIKCAPRHSEWMN